MLTLALQIDFLTKNSLLDNRKVTEKINVKQQNILIVYISTWCSKKHSLIFKFLNQSTHLHKLNKIFLERLGNNSMDTPITICNRKSGIATKTALRHTQRLQRWDR